MRSGKERILCVERIIQARRTVSVPQILGDLERKYDIHADRKTIYDDIAVLTQFMPITTCGAGHSHKYVLTEFPMGGRL